MLWLVCKVLEKNLQCDIEILCNFITSKCQGAQCLHNMPYNKYCTSAFLNHHKTTEHWSREKKELQQVTKQDNEQGRFKIKQPFLIQFADVPLKLGTVYSKYLMLLLFSKKLGSSDLHLRNDNVQEAARLDVNRSKHKILDFINSDNFSSIIIFVCGRSSFWLWQTSKGFDFLWTLLGVIRLDNVFLWLYIA